MARDANAQSYENIKRYIHRHYKAGDANTQSYENIRGTLTAIIWQEMQMDRVMRTSRGIHRHNKVGDANTQRYENVRGAVMAIIWQKMQIHRFKRHLSSTTEFECENAAFLLCYAT